MSEPDLARNLETLDGYLARFRDTGIRNRIAGADRDGGGACSRPHHRSMKA